MRGDEIHCSHAVGSLKSEGGNTIEIGFMADLCISPSVRNVIVVIVPHHVVGKDGKSHSDWIRFSTREIHSNFSIRTFDIARDGYNAKKRAIKKLPPFEPAKLTYFAIYTRGIKRDGKERSYTLDYVRVTEHPASGKKASKE